MYSTNFRINFYIPTRQRKGEIALAGTKDHLRWRVEQSISHLKNYKAIAIRRQRFDFCYQATVDLALLIDLVRKIKKNFQNSDLVSDLVFLKQVQGLTMKKLFLLVLLTTLTYSQTHNVRFAELEDLEQALQFDREVTFEFFKPLYQKYYSDFPQGKDPDHFLNLELNEDKQYFQDAIFQKNLVDF